MESAASASARSRSFSFSASRARKSFAREVRTGGVFEVRGGVGCRVGSDLLALRESAVEGVVEFDETTLDRYTERAGSVEYAPAPPPPPPSSSMSSPSANNPLLLIGTSPPNNPPTATGSTIELMAGILILFGRGGVGP